MMRLIGAVSLMIITLLVCGAIIGALVANYSYREPVYAYQILDPYKPIIITTYPPYQGGSGSGPDYPRPPGTTTVVTSGSGYLPRLPDDLVLAADLDAPRGGLFLLSVADMAIKEAAVITDISFEKMIELMKKPDAYLLQQGFVSPLHEAVQVTPLGSVDETLYVLITYAGGEILGSYAEAAMLDALILSITTFPDVSQVQFVVDLRLGYQGRFDLSYPCSRSTLFSTR